MFVYTPAPQILVQISWSKTQQLQPLYRKSTSIRTLKSEISNFQTWFVRTVMEVLKYCWM